MLFPGSPVPSANSIINNSKTTTPPAAFCSRGFLLAFPAKSIRISVLPIIHFRRKCETDSGIKCLVRQDDGALCTKRMGARTCFIDQRFRQTVLSVFRHSGDRLNISGVTGCVPQAAVRAIFAVGNCKGFQRVVCVGDSLQQFRIPFFGRAVIVKPSVNHQLALPWIGGKFPQAHGIAVRQKIDQRIGQIIQNVPNENARCNPAFPLSKEIGKCFDTAR